MSLDLDLHAATKAELTRWMKHVPWFPPYVHQKDKEADEAKKRERLEKIKASKLTLMNPGPK
jgi:hypothetical protein